MALLLLAACGPERHTDLEGLGPITLELSNFSQGLMVDIVYERDDDERCPVLGDDFMVQLGDIPLSTWPGGMVENCWSPGTGSPCMEAPSTCEMPGASARGPFEGPTPILAIGDASRIIECKLGDAFLTRTVTRVPDIGWQVSLGELVTVRWSPGGDLARFTTSVRFAGADDHSAYFPIALDHAIDGDLITFQIPSRAQFPARLLFDVGGTTPTTMDGCTALNTRHYGYFVDVMLDTQ